MHWQLNLHNRLNFWFCQVIHYFTGSTKIRNPVESSRFSNWIVQKLPENNVNSNVTVFDLWHQRKKSKYLSIMYRSNGSFNIPPPLPPPRAFDPFAFPGVGNLIPMHKEWGIWSVSSMSCACETWDTTCKHWWRPRLCMLL